MNIHETADVAGAERFWQGVTGADPARFLRTTLKRHNPRTVRKNVGADYHGCLIVSVRQSADLYRRIEGWAGAESWPKRRGRATGIEPTAAELPGEDSNLC